MVRIDLTEEEAKSLLAVTPAGVIRTREVRIQALDKIRAALQSSKGQGEA